MTNTDTKTTVKPSLFMLASEVGRAAIEWGAFKITQPLLNRTKQGDGHPVLVVPGFMTTNSTTKTFRKHLFSIGYTPYGWTLGRNYGKPAYIDHIIQQIEELSIQHDQKVSIIGWSLGGIFAREAAKLCPNLVRQVITLGSPFRGLRESNNVSLVYQAISRGKRHQDLDPDFLDSLNIMPTVPTTAIFSKGDGVVSWEHCMEVEENDISQNIEVKGSHLGLLHNPTVLPIIANRLRQNVYNWKKFQPSEGFLNQMLYPNLALA